MAAAIIFNGHFFIIKINLFINWEVQAVRVRNCCFKISNYSARWERGTPTAPLTLFFIFFMFFLEFIKVLASLASLVLKRYFIFEFIF